ncbi:Pentatricopeptide repeat-containing protein [Rhynchospora pubera]|uniref:Pentatricopeptide repeat-containing protein n=1 Tax=Rhynchospora pubera TaxID=906938 RepID=A0AAV8F0W0_9POAL|nr:Pentatricopeptide repeat-containing protein [Rhynchospora pubera]
MNPSMAPPLSTLSPSTMAVSHFPLSKPFYPKPTSSTSSPSLQCHSSISEQLRPLSLSLLKDTPAHGESAHSKPTWLNPTKSKPNVISLVRHRKTKPTSNGNPQSLLLNPTLLQTLVSIPDSDKYLFFSTLTEAFPSPPSDDDVLFLLNSLYRHPKKSILLLEWLKESSFQLETIFYNLVLKSLRNTRQWDQIDRIASDMLHHGPQPDNITFSTVISAAHKCQRFEKAIEWFDMMYSAGVIPDEVTFSAILKVYAILGKKEEAIILYERGRATGWKPDHVAFSVLGKLFGDAGDQDGMLYMRDEMKRLNIVPNVVVYNTLINGFGRAGRPNIAKELFEEMCKLGVNPDERTLTAIFKIYGKYKRTHDAMDVWARMKENRWPMDQILYNTILTMCADLGMESEAEKIFEEMKQSYKCLPDKWTYSVMIKLYCRRSKSDCAWKLLFEEMPQRNLQPDVTCYTSLIDCLGKEGRVDDVVAAFESAMETVPSQIDDQLCCCLLSTMARCKDEMQMNAILACIEKASPMLHSLICMLWNESIGFDEIKKSFRELLSKAPINVRRPYCNCLIDMCTFRPGFPSDRPRELFHLGNIYGLYQGLQTQRLSEWSVDLRRLSLGAARAALDDWLESVAEAVEDSERLPPQFRIFTGYGLDRFKSALPNYLEGYLSDAGAPFHKSEKMAGSFVAEKADLLQWLHGQGILTVDVSEIL